MVFLFILRVAWLILYSNAGVLFDRAMLDPEQVRRQAPSDPGRDRVDGAGVPEQAERLDWVEKPQTGMRGGFGEVYRATMVSPTGLQTVVALKVLRRDVPPRSQAV